jgi:hypothetical protein
MSRRVQACANAVERWTEEAPEEIQELWKRIAITVWKTSDNTELCTLSWAEWKLDIATFKVPPYGQEVDLEITTEQRLVHCPEGAKELFTSRNRNPSGRPATVFEVVDAFLSNEWTPHWCCQVCRKRQSKKIIVE